MKSFKKLVLALAITTTLASCEKAPVAEFPKVYSSVDEFFEKNNVPLQSYGANGSMGATFVTPQGTTINIPPYCFITQMGDTVTGTVTIEFKDIYKKSDMFLSRMATQTIFNNPLKSGGEFYIKATYAGLPVFIYPGKKITVTQPALLTGGLDPLNPMTPFVFTNDTISGGPLTSIWYPTTNDSVYTIANAYVFSLYQFSEPVDQGTWCNSDNASFFSAYPQTQLSLVPNNSYDDYHPEVFLVFKDLSSMVHVYYSPASDNFPYSYAPQGLECTMVAVGVKNGLLYSSFVPITIGANQTVSFSLSPTTTDIFMDHLNSLN